MAVHNRFHTKQEQLREEVRLREKRIHELTEQLEHNFGKMALNSFMSSPRGKSGASGSFFSTLGDLASRIFTSGSFTGSKQGFQSWQVLAAGLAFRYIRKMMKKRKD